MVGVLATLIFLLTLSSQGTLRICGRLQGVELTILSGEETSFSGVLPRISLSDSAIVADLQDQVSPIPVLLRKRIKVFVGKDVRRLEIDLNADFSDLNFYFDGGLDTLIVHLRSKFTDLKLEGKGIALLNFDGFNVGGSLRFRCERERDSIVVSGLRTTYEVRGVFEGGFYEFNSRYCNIWLPLGNYRAQVMGLLNSGLESLEGGSGSKSFIIVNGILNKIGRVYP